MNLTELVRLSLDEDIGLGDVTTTACVGGGAGRARIYAKSPLVVSGQAAAAETFRQVGASYTATVADGTAVEPGQDVGWAEGPLRALLTGERVALNFLMRLCGIATHTRAVVAAAGGLKVVDTRKTTPLHRALEKAAVRHGGAHNHRFGLFDGVLIKDNHIVAAGGITPAVAAARASAHPLLKVEVEVETLDELSEALAAGADVILLDNMDDATLAAAIAVVEAAGLRGRVLLEASGNLTAERMPRLAGLGLSYVSMGGLIHQARWADLSLRILPVGGR